MLTAVLCAAALVAPPARASSPEFDRVSVDARSRRGPARARPLPEAAEKALLLRDQALALPPSGDARRLVVRAEVVAGSAAVALGQLGVAQDCFARALRLEPWLSRSGTPPKVRRSFDAAKAMAQMSPTPTRDAFGLTADPVRLRAPASRSSRRWRSWSGRSPGRLPVRR